MPTTETELKLMAAAAIIGFNTRPNTGYKNASRNRHAERVVHERKHRFCRTFLMVAR